MVAIMVGHRGFSARDPRDGELKKPHLVVNISNCVAGGGYQIAVWFVNRLMQNPPDNYTISYVINAKHVDQLPPTGSETLVVDTSPMRSLAVRQRIYAFLNAQTTDCVLSLFGPSGIIHPQQICGVANAFITSLSAANLRQAHGRAWPLHYLRYLLYGRMLAGSRFLIFETGGERDRFAARWHYPRERTAVIGNSVNDVFIGAQAHPVARSARDRARFLFVTSVHPHKNNHMIPDYVTALRRAGLEHFTLALTLTPEEGAPLLKALGDDAGHIELLGKLAPEELLAQYRRCDVVVQPSSLETYSGVYNEVRFVPRALLASDRPFAREICDGFAHFFEPLDADSFAASATALLVALPQAERAAWDARTGVLLPDAKYQKIVDVVAAVSEATKNATNTAVGR